MATILDLFKANKKEIYGKLGEIYIDSRGFINPPRAAALAASSPNVAADLIGGQLAGVIGGTANRPSDTIFKKGNPGSKPITITAATQALLRDAVDGEYGKDGTNSGGYVIKTSKSPDSVLADIAQGGSTASGVATNLAISALNTYGSKGGFNKLKEDLKTKKTGADKNGSFNAPRYTNEKPFSKYKEATGRDLAEKNKKLDTLDGAIIRILDNASYDSYDAFKQKIDQYPNANHVPVIFRKYGNNTVVPFVGAVTAISEDVQPEWNSFKYIGSPFKTYRYNGVERSLKFNLKLYYHQPSQKQVMIKKINYLKSLTFPFETTSTIYYGEKSDKNAQIGFSPNLLFVSIGDMYKNVFGYMESLSFSIDENVTWVNAEDDFADKASTKSSLYPSVIDVSIGIKLIENSHEIEKGTSTYNYNFDGRTTETDIVEAKQEKEKTKTEFKPKTSQDPPKIDLTLSEERKATMSTEQIAVYDGYSSMKQ